jgi:hypothetical protein
LLQKPYAAAEQIAGTVGARGQINPQPPRIALPASRLISSC